MLKGSKFVNEMYFAVVEECPLAEVATGTTDLEATGAVRHGPLGPC